LRTMMYGDQLTALQRAEIDLGLGPLSPDDRVFEGKCIARVRPIVAVPVNDPLAGEPVAAWSMLDGRDAVLVDPTRASISRQWIDSMLASRGVTIREL